MKPKSSWIAVIIFVFAVSSTLGFAQAGAGSSGTGGSTGGSAERSPSAGSSVGKDANAAVLQNLGRSGDYLIGNVNVEGNPLLWEPVSVAIYCDGHERAQTYADAKGNFEFRSTTIEGPAVQNPKKVNLTALYTGCSVRASLSGYRSSSVLIANRNMVDNPDIGTVRLSLDEHATGTATSGTSKSAPKGALKSFEKARDDMMQGKADKAKDDLQKAVKEYPQFALAWYELGMLQRQSNQDALNSFQKSVAADPQFVPPYQQLAELNAAQQKWQDVANDVAQSLKLDPDGTPQIWYYDAVAKFNLQDRKGAEVSAKKSLEMDPNHVAPNTEQLLAVIEAGRGDYKEALAHLQHSLTYLPDGPNKELVKKQVAQIEGHAPGAQ